MQTVSSTTIDQGEWIFCVTPVIKGTTPQLRVGINALDLVTRQLALENGGDTAEAARLKTLFGIDEPLIDLNQRCRIGDR